MEQAWNELEPLHAAKDAAAADSIFRNILTKFGVGQFAYLGLNLGPGRVAPLLVSTYPSEWCERYLERRYYGIDPVIHGARQKMFPFEWGSRAYLSELHDSQKHFFLEARDFGIASGITYPVHGAQGQFAVISLVSDQPLTLDLNGQNVLQLAAMHYHMRQVANQKPSPDERIVELTPREAECLTWAANGKSAWEIGRILNISRYTVQEHMDNAKRKLGCHTRDHAVVKAVMQGLISP